MSNPEIDRYGNKFWYNEKRLYHREDGPAVEHADGDKFWYKNGKRHREDGPAVEQVNEDTPWYWYRTSKWWYHGKQINCSSNEEFLRIIKLKAFW